MTFPASCVLSGLGDPLPDTDTWKIDLTLGDSGTGQPFNLTGTVLKVTFRDYVTFAEVVTLSTAPTNAAFTITDAPNGKVSIVSPASARTYRIARPLAGTPAILVSTIIGDVMRTVGSGAPEFIGQIQLRVRAGTTEP